MTLNVVSMAEMMASLISTYSKELSLGESLFSKKVVELLRFLHFLLHRR